MATKITVTLEDDLDGGPAEETVQFGLGGAAYQIDLTNNNARPFGKQLAPYIDTPARQDQHRGAGRDRPQPASSAAATSGPGPKTRASRSAPAGASLPAWWTVLGRRQTTLTHAQTAVANQTRPGACGLDGQSTTRGQTLPPARTCLNSGCRPRA
jgi:hypothetical protein